MIKVVVIDDDLDLLEMVCMMLNNPKMSPVCIDDGDNLVPTLSTVQPDVLVMDIFLGHHDGRALCKKLKSNNEFSRLPILLYSAGEISPESILDSNADDFIKKPFEMPELMRRIEELANN